MGSCEASEPGDGVGSHVGGGVQVRLSAQMRM